MESSYTPVGVQFCAFLNTKAPADVQRVLNYCLKQLIEYDAARDWITGLLLQSVTQKGSDQSAYSWWVLSPSLPDRAKKLAQVAIAISMHWYSDAWKPDFEEVFGDVGFLRLVETFNRIENHLDWERDASV